MDQRAAEVAARALLFVSLSAAAPHQPLPSRAPEVLAPPSLRVHVRAHEDLEPDTLRAFARPRVTLWLETRSNVLKASTLEHLRRFDSTFVRLRAPLNETHARAFSAAPRAGAWLDAAWLEGKGVQRALGPRPLAVQVKGPLDEALFEKLKRARPEWVEWAAPPEVDVLAFSLLKQLPGRRLVSLEPGGLQARACPAGVEDDGPAARVHLATLLALGAAAFPCGRSPVVVIAADTDRWLIQSVVVRDPAAELELNVGADEAQAKKALALLDELGLGPRR
ncbi:MAG: hypothetical protein JNK82_02500 [Myxococcaceae bacterium]|nr:hypothetical protein [Myxococcaceae bacterium]